MHWSDLNEKCLNWKVIKYCKISIKMKVELFEKFLTIVCKTNIKYPTQYSESDDCIYLHIDMCPYFININNYFNPWYMPTKCLGWYTSGTYYINNSIEIEEYY